MTYFDCVVIGGGAAGLMCAAQAGWRGKRVTVLDHANKVGKKILMSGGGRCNFTNYFVEPSNYLSANPHFCKSALSRYSQYDFLELVSKYDLAYHEKTLGQLFCNNKAKDILNILLAECDGAGVRIATECDIHSITATHAAVDNANTADEARFALQTTHGEIHCHSLVIASGGLSIPTMGATGFGYDIAKQFGLRITPRHASLVPFTFKGAQLTTAQNLAGVALPVRIECNNQSFSEALLFTHKGISGPAVLQVSNYWWPEQPITIDFLPDTDLAPQIATWQREGQKAELKNLLSRLLPKRFITEWLDTHPATAPLADKTVAQLSNTDIAALTEHLKNWQCTPAGTEGYKTAEVTRGGVNTDDVSSKTFEAKKVPGLFFIGEVLDVTGWLGGFNFQWAWASGYCAAQFV
ncbi:MAG TPA: NAD(P)/FAD-dependent oxidoreductase [Marinagarivorans sp.]